jgi:16S rRNA processing protein RimM
VTAPAVVIGRVGRPHGLRGALRVQPTGPTLATLELGEEVEVHSPGVPPRPMALAGREGTADRPILWLAGLESRDAAAALTGATLRVPAGRIAALPGPDTYYVRDLVGCEVLIGPRSAGAVVAVHEAPANDVLEVSGPGGDLLVPFTADAVRELDLPGRRIVVRPDLFPV